MSVVSDVYVCTLITLASLCYVYMCVAFVFICTTNKLWKKKVNTHIVTYLSEQNFHFDTVEWIREVIEHLMFASVVPCEGGWWCCRRMVKQ